MTQEPSSVECAWVGGTTNGSAASKFRYPTGVQHPTTDDKNGTERKEPEIPGERSSEVVSYVVDLKKVVVDDAFDEVEQAPSGE